MRTIFLLLFAAIPGLLVSQVTSTATMGSYSVGEGSISFTDNGLQTPGVSAHIWYPGTTSGTGSPVANGNFPTIAFGHGFNMGYLDYTQICGHLASWGYIVVSPNVQNGFSVSHQEFAKELVACLNYFSAQGLDNQSNFYQHVDTMTGVFGHSMGGGASCLVPSVFPQIDAVSGLAPAETTPSAIAALPGYSGPYQVISGSSDNTAPESSNQTPMYNAAAGTKQWVSITGGAHCKFSDGTTICDLVSSAGSVTRAYQVYLAKKYVTAFFNFNLKGDLDAMPFLCGDSLQADVMGNHVTRQTTFNCNVVALSPQAAESSCWTVSPNPSTGFVKIQGTTGGFTIQDAMGRVVFSGNSIEKTTEIDLSGMARGIYFLHPNGKSCNQILVKE